MIKFLRIVALCGFCLLQSDLFGKPESSALDPEHARELLRYMYRWHLDDAVLADQLTGKESISIYYKPIRPEKSDEYDDSEYLEVVLPFAQMYMRLKRADYRIHKLGIEIDNRNFKLQSAHHFPDTGFDPTGYERMEFNLEETLEHLFRTRNDHIFPEEQDLLILREKAILALNESAFAGRLANQDETQIFYVAPISPVANELWVFWVNGEVFLHFTSDIDEEHPSFWSLAHIDVEVIDARGQVVVTNLERNSHSYFTKDYIGRILYNCIIHGQLLKIVE